MPPVRSISSTVRRAHTVALVLSLGEVMPLCSCCAKEGLVYIAIAAPSGRQPSSCSECTKSNVRLSCDVHSVSNAECTFCISRYYLRLSCLNGNTWYYAALSALLCTL